MLEFRFLPNLHPVFFTNVVMNYLSGMTGEMSAMEMFHQSTVLVSYGSQLMCLCPLFGTCLHVG